MYTLIEGTMGKCPEGLFLYLNCLMHCPTPIQVSDEHREFAMGATSVADTTGITLAGISSIFLHNYICEHVIDNISPTCPS